MAKIGATKPMPVSKAKSERIKTFMTLLMLINLNIDGRYSNYLIYCSSPQYSLGIDALGLPCFTHWSFWQSQQSSPLKKLRQSELSPIFKNLKPKITKTATISKTTIIKLVFFTFLKLLRIIESLYFNTALHLNEVPGASMKDNFILVIYCKARQKSSQR